MPTLSIITATLNVASIVGDLAADLAAQTDADFEWIVVDGGSTDDTVALVRAGFKGRLILIQEPDFGIYDALNKGLRRCTSDYYLVMGADDRLASDAVARYRRLAEDSGADIVTASVRDGDAIARPGRGQAWRRGHLAFVSQHAVGALFKRSLHDRFGFYSRSFPIAADQLFIKQAVQGGASVHAAPDFIAGDFSRTGVSSTQFAATLFEFARVQLRTEKNRSFQLLLFMVRLLLHWRKVVQ